MKYLFSFFLSILKFRQCSDCRPFSQAGNWAPSVATAGPDHSNPKDLFSRDIFFLINLVWIVSYISNLFFYMHCMKTMLITQCDVYEDLKPFLKKIWVFSVMDTHLKRGTSVRVGGYGVCVTQIMKTVLKICLLSAVLCLKVMCCGANNV